MNKTVVFFDIDGTLIHCAAGVFKPTEKTVQCLQELKAKGALLFLATGRPYCFLNEEIKQLPFDGCLTSNGAVTIADGVIVSSLFLSQDIVEEMLGCAKEYEFGYHLETPTKLFVSEFKHSYIENYFLKYGLPSFEKDHDISHFKKVTNKMGIYLTHDHDIYALQERFKGRLVFYKVEDCVYEACLLKVNKGTAIQAFMDKKKNSDYMTFAFGDSSNDLDMFQVVDYPVAMGECDPRLCRYAKYQTKSVKDEGIYHFWQYYQKEEKSTTNI